MSEVLIGSYYCIVAFGLGLLAVIVLVGPGKLRSFKRSPVLEGHLDRLAGGALLSESSF